tara:strand:- start:60 stop:209 length:150 start_codon:yes stop_codon:yes gene_type:complete
MMTKIDEHDVRVHKAFFVKMKENDELRLAVEFTHGDGLEKTGPCILDQD